MKNKVLLLSLGFLCAGLLACNKKENTAKSESEGASRGDSVATQSGPPVLLKAKWPVGNRYVFRMDIDQHSTNQMPQMPQPMHQDVLMAMTYAISVVKETAGGGRELEMEFVANEMEVKMGEQVVMSFDSKENAAGDAKNPFAAPYRKMIGTKLIMQMDANGRLEKIVGLDEWTDTVAGGAGSPSQGMIKSQFNEGYFRQLVDVGMGFPAKPVKVGESWPFQMDVPAGPLGKISLDLKITFKGWADHEKHKTVVLNSTGAMKGGGQAEAGPMGKMKIEAGRMMGTIFFDPELGGLIETSSDQNMTIKGEMPGQGGGNPPSGNFTSNVGQKVKVKLVELTEAKK